VDEHTISPAGDPFYAASRHPDEETPHGCIDGFVYVGHMVEDPETGQEVEVFDAVPCRRCSDSR
jgi:hypothetical protein